jgi:nitrous oxidase accessory protein NosD
MHKIAGLLLVLFFLSASCIVATRPVKAAQIIIVPDDYTTIAEAIDNTDNGDTILVRSGTYNETLIIDTSIRLVGDSPTTTLINGPSFYNSSAGIPPNSSVAIDVATSNVEISSVAINNGEGLGILVQQGSEGALIADNVVNSGIGISILGSFAWVDENTISGYSTAVRCAGSYCNITDNNIPSSPNYGIDLEGYQNLISGNSITDLNGEGYGIFIANSSNLVDSNTIFEKSEGISVSGGSHNTVSSNSLANCSSNGLRIDSGFNNTFTMNIVSTCNYGASVGLGAYDSIFYFNDFVDNVHQVFVRSSASISWDNGEEGNFWSDYLTRYPNATEIENSGFWNTPYAINANNADNYPLVSPYETFTPSSAPFPTLLVVAVSVVVVVVIAVGVFVYLRKREG